MMLRRVVSTTDLSNQHSRFAEDHSSSIKVKDGRDRSLQEERGEKTGEYFAPNEDNSSLSNNSSLNNMRNRIKDLFPQLTNDNNIKDCLIGALQQSRKENPIKEVIENYLNAAVFYQQAIDTSNDSIDSTNSHQANYIVY
jgi:hypothetical protein